MFTSGHVTRWRSHHSIRRSGKPHAADKLRGRMSYRTGVIVDSICKLRK